MGNARYMAAMLMAGLLALGGCGVQGSRDGSSRGTGSGGASDAARGAPATEVRVDRSFWHRGFKVTLGTARVMGAKADEPRVVTIEATFQNLSTDDEETPIPYALLTVGDRTYTTAAREHQKLPVVLAQRNQSGMIAFEVDERFVLAEAVLVVGEPKVRQALVPLGRAEGLVSLEPRAVTVSGRVTHDDEDYFFMTVAGGEVRADDPASHYEAPTGKEYLRLSFSATNNSRAGMAYVFDRDLTLKLPDGTAVGHDLNCSHAQIHAQPHSTESGGMVCFLVPTPAAGTYTLMWSNYEKGALRVSVG
jgi:hypothetical protein